MRLSETFGVLASSWRKSRIITILSMLQTLVLRISPDTEGEATSNQQDDCQYECFVAPTPLVPLARANAASLLSGMTGWLLLSLAKVGTLGERLLRLAGLGPDAVKTHAPMQTLWLCWDSLKTNVAVLKSLRVAQTQAHEDDTARFLLSCKCLIHQAALVRKSIINNFPGHFSSIVRLGHLYEIHSFRNDFRTALIGVVQDSFRFVEVPELPPECERWRNERMQAASMQDSDPSYSRVRRSLHQQLMTWDNGDCSKDSFVHYCTGSCCVGSSTDERREYAKLQVCKILYLIFGLGYPLPLLYRWLHVHRALQFCREGISIHRLLPRVLERMKKPHKQSASEMLLCAKIEEADVADEGPDETRLEETPAVLAQKRRLLTSNAFADPLFLQRTVLLETLTAPIAVMMHFLLKRSGQLTQLAHLPRASDDRDRLRQESLVSV